MNETQRRAYLQVMGIQPYFPRVPVPGAKQSPQYVIEIPVTASSVAVSNTENLAPVALTPVTDLPKPRKAQGKANITKVPATDLPRTSLPETPILPSTGSSEWEDRLHFRVNYYRISSTLAVIDEVPFQQQTQEPDAVRLLLKAILQALGVNLETTGLQPDQFNWPLESGIKVKGDPALAAQQALLGYITMRQQRDGFEQLLVFSAQLSTLLLRDMAGQGTELDRFDQLAAGGHFHITVTHSLQSLLAHPILKRETWEHLQALRQRMVSLGS